MRPMIALLLVFSCALHAEQQASPVADIPLIGFGTWHLDRNNASDAIVAAFKTGYRHFDCAPIYGNEKEVGSGIRDGAAQAGVKREGYWVTSKLWNDHHRPDLVPKALDKTLSDLGLEYLDLYLMHWPVEANDDGMEINYIDTWKAMNELLSAGKTRHVGVSNFSPMQMAAILPIAKPYAHQFETHPYLQQNEFIAVHKKQGIEVTAYSPLGNQNPIYTSWKKDVSADQVPPLLENQVMKKIADQRGCTPAQVALKWGMLRGTSVIPKSQRLDRMDENWRSIECNLYPEDFQTIGKSLPVVRFNNPSASWGVRLFKGRDGASSVMDAVRDNVAWLKSLVPSLPVGAYFKKYQDLLHGEL